MSREPEFRRDPVCGRWTVVAPERLQRPITLEGAEPRHRHNGEARPCPFCPGNESETPHELLAHRADRSLPDGPGWQLRVVPNKFPGVRPDLGENKCATGGGLFVSTSGLGHAEVIIECPEHLPDPTALSIDQLAAVFQAYRDRALALASDPRVIYASIFKNVGAEAGASLGHTHSQIVATPIVPEVILTELSAAERFHARTGRCLFCDLLFFELTTGERLVAQSEHFLAIAAFAPRFAYEFWILPRAHSSRYETITDLECRDLAGLTRRTLLALDGVQGQPAYNWFLHVPPLRSPDLAHFHWHLEVLPRTGRPAGLEWGYGCFITAVAPEQAATELRAALPDVRAAVG